MLYKRNDSPSLSEELFRNPTSEYRGAPFWSWNCKLDKDQLLRQVGQMKQMGFGGFHIHARTGLETAYLSDEFMELVKACCDKAESLDLMTWLYDEDRFSSGTAGGRVTKNLLFRRKRLKLRSQDMGWETPKEQALREGVPYRLACYDVVLDENGYLDHYRRIEREEQAEGRKWYAYVAPDDPSDWYNGQTYVDTMDAEATREFIRVTHERYKEIIGERFGKTVPAIFTDEPFVNTKGNETVPVPEVDGRIHRGWTRTFEEEYQKAYGEDILDRLPELIWDKADRSDSVVKYRYCDLKAKLFSENYMGQIGSWCRENGLAFTGHVLDEPMLRGQTSSVGETMRGYGQMDLPGIDIVCDKREFTSAKQAQSAVHQYGKEGMMSELYGVNGWDFDLRSHKHSGDWQAALGVTVRVPHLAWVSMKGEAKRDYPAPIGYQSPWYQEYGNIEDHYARLNTALTRGKPIVKVGVIHPIESNWIMIGPASQNSARTGALERNFKNITEWMLQNHQDFDFICESTLPQLGDADSCSVGKMRYEAIVVPGCLTLRKSTIAYLDAFRKAGGNVIFMGTCPEYVDGEKSDGCAALFDESTRIGFDAAELTAALEGLRCVGIRLANGSEAVNYVYNYRQDNDCRWLFIAQCNRPDQLDVAPAVPLTITVKGIYSPVEYDTMTGSIKPVDFSHVGGNTRIVYSLDSCGSLLLRLSETVDVPAVTDRQWEKGEEISVPATVRYSLSEPNVLLLDQAMWALDDGPWQKKEELLRIDCQCRTMLGYPDRHGNLVQPYIRGPQPEEHQLHLQFRFESALELENVSLAIEDADKIEAILNGQKVSGRITGWFTDESIQTLSLPTIRQGENLLEITIPYGPQTNVEWCYLLGQFGVHVMGTAVQLIPMQSQMGFSSVTAQGLPFYGANVTYHVEAELPEDGGLQVRANCYRGAMIGVSLDGQRVGSIILPPYTLRIPDVSAGKHTVSLTVFGNRFNSFGMLHMVNQFTKWQGPEVWRTTGDGWCYEYLTRPFGLLKAPQITILK